MSTLFAFLHHLCAFTLVAAVAIEFTLIRGELTLSSARRLQVDRSACLALPQARCSSSGYCGYSFSRRARRIIFTATLSC